MLKQVSAWRIVATIQPVTQQKNIHVATSVSKVHAENHTGNSILCLMPKTKPNQTKHLLFWRDWRQVQRRCHFKSESKILPFLFELKGCNRSRPSREKARLCRTLPVHRKLVTGPHDFLICLHASHESSPYWLSKGSPLSLGLAGFIPWRPLDTATRLGEFLDSWGVCREGNKSHIASPYYSFLALFSAFPNLQSFAF